MGSDSWYDCQNCGKDCMLPYTRHYIVEEDGMGGDSFILCYDCLNDGLRLLNQDKMKGQR